MESGRVLLGKLKKQNDLKTSYIRRIAVVDQIYQQVILWVAVIIHLLRAINMTPPEIWRHSILLYYAPIDSSTSGTIAKFKPESLWYLSYQNLSL